MDTVVFDKTGTLTLPEPCVDETADIDPAMLENAARLALSSRHPLAAALARKARARVPFPGAVEEPGLGVRAQIDGAEARLGSADFCGLPPSKPPSPLTIPPRRSSPSPTPARPRPLPFARPCGLTPRR